jgi:SulP family sulfate permease
VVIAAVVKLVRFRPLLELWRLSTPQAVIGWSTFILTLVLAPHIEEAIILSVLLALGLHVWRELSPGYVVRHVGDALHLEVVGVLWFGSAPTLEKALRNHLEEARNARRVVLDLGGVGRLDLTGALLLRRIRRDVEEAGLELELTEVPEHAHRILGQVLDWRQEHEPGIRGLEGGR